jgi:hypothetical protein
MEFQLVPLNVTYCDVLPESRDIGGRIYDCFLDNGAAKHNSPHKEPSDYATVTHVACQPLEQ